MTKILLALMVFNLGLAHAEDYGVYKIESSNLSKGLRVTGRIVPLEGTLYIESARFQGRVLSVIAKEGSEVRSGSRLLLVNSAECQSLYQEKKMAKEKNLDDMLAVVRVREKQLAMETDGGSCYVIASTVGVVTKKMVEAGSSFNPGDNFFTLVNRKALTTELDVPERDGLNLKKGEKVVVQRPSDPSTLYESKIESIVPSISSVSRTVKVRLTKIDFKNNPTIDEFIFGDIQLLGEGVTFKVPSSGVVFSGDNDFVIKLVDKKMQKVQVTVVNQADKFFYIREKVLHTLQVGDDIISNGAVMQFEKNFKQE